MITVHDISAADPSERPKLHNHLIVERMNFDRRFAEYLDAHELDENNIDTPEWKQYRAMMEQYGELSQLIRTSQYYLEKYGTN